MLTFKRLDDISDVPCSVQWIISLGQQCDGLNGDKTISGRLQRALEKRICSFIVSFLTLLSKRYSLLSWSQFQCVISRVMVWVQLIIETPHLLVLSLNPPLCCAPPDFAAAHLWIRLPWTEWYSRFWFVLGHVSLTFSAEYCWTDLHLGPFSWFEPHKDHKQYDLTSVFLCTLSPLDKWQ